MLVHGCLVHSDHFAITVLPGQGNMQGAIVGGARAVREGERQRL